MLSHARRWIVRAPKSRRPVSAFASLEIPVRRVQSVGCLGRQQAKRMSSSLGPARAHPFLTPSRGGGSRALRFSPFENDNAALRSALEAPAPEPRPSFKSRRRDMHQGKDIAVFCPVVGWLVGCQLISMGLATHDRLRGRWCVAGAARSHLERKPFDLCDASMHTHCGGRPLDQRYFQEGALRARSGMELRRNFDRLFVVDKHQKDARWQPSRILIRRSTERRFRCRVTSWTSFTRSPTRPSACSRSRPPPRTSPSRRLWRSRGFCTSVVSYGWLPTTRASDSCHA